MSIPGGRASPSRSCGRARHGSFFENPLFVRPIRGDGLAKSINSLDIWSIFRPGGAPPRGLFFFESGLEYQHPPRSVSPAWGRLRKRILDMESFFGSLSLWLNAILFKDIEQRNGFLEYSNAHGVMTRPLWNLTPKLPMYSDCQADELSHARWLEERLVNIPSSVIP